MSPPDLLSSGGGWRLFPGSSSAPRGFIFTVGLFMALVSLRGRGGGPPPPFPEQVPGCPGRGWAPPCAGFTWEPGSTAPPQLPLLWGVCQGPDFAAALGVGLPSRPLPRLGSSIPLSTRLHQTSSLSLPRAVFKSHPPRLFFLLLFPLFSKGRKGNGC